MQTDLASDRIKNHICTHIGTRCQNANAANATHLLWCKFMCKCFKRCQLKDIGWLMCRYFTTLHMILSFNHGLTKIIFKQSIYAFQVVDHIWTWIRTVANVLHSRHLHFGTGCQCECKSDFSSRYYSSYISLDSKRHQVGPNQIFLGIKLMNPSSCTTQWHKSNGWHKSNEILKIIT